MDAAVRRRKEAELSGIRGVTAIVTGAGRGIGKAVAGALFEAGARVAMLARMESVLREVREQWLTPSGEGPMAAGAAAGGRKASGRDGDLFVIACDVTDPGSVHAAAATAAEALGPAGILVNAAGDAVSAPFLKTDDALWNRMLAVNLSGAFRMTRAVVPAMIERGGGRVVNIASVAGLTGARYVSAYTAAKHGLVGLTRALADELAGHGITVNAVCPGYVDTPMTDRSVANIVAKTGRTEAEVRQTLMSRSPQNRLMTPEEVASLVLYLVSDEARGVNGQAIVLDGGGFVR